jgi:hypothetical protein
MSTTFGRYQTVAILLSVLLAVGATAATPKADSPSQVVEPGLTYGAAGDLSLPKTIIFSAGPDAIIRDAEEWARRGVSAFFLDFVARDWSSDVWAQDQKPWTIGESDETFQKVKQANAVCRRIGSETFLKIAFDHPFEWFNDTAWRKIAENFRQFAVFARESGCNGIALDIEYVGEQYDFAWPGYTYGDYDQEGLFKKVTERVTDVMRVLYDNFPDMVFLTFPEEGFSLGTAIHVAWLEEAARRNAPGGFHYCTESTYRDPNIRYMFGHAWACNELFQVLLSRRAREYWMAHGSIAAGIWPFGFDYQNVHAPGLSCEQFRQGYAASLMVSSRYNWIYSHNCYDQLIGRNLDAYKGDADLTQYLAIISERNIVTSPKYVELARRLRSLEQGDYGPDLGLAVVPQLAGPADVPSLGLIPEGFMNPDLSRMGWKVALDYFRGTVVDVHKLFGTQTHWMLIGPFENGEGFAGHSAVYPPEKEISLSAEYDGVGGKVRWTEYEPKDQHASVDLTKVFSPTEHVTAYALCYVTLDADCDVQIRIGTNDAGKMWVGGHLVYDYPEEGTAILDRDIVRVALPKGTTPILLKISNGVKNWGFVFRITDAQGRLLPSLRFSVKIP